MIRRPVFFLIFLLIPVIATLHAIDNLWQFPTGGRILSRPVEDDDGLIYCISEDRYLYCVSPTGSLNWRSYLGFRFHDAFTRGPDGTFYIGGKTGTLSAVNRTGRELWKLSFASPLAGDPIVLRNGQIITLTEDGTMTCVLHSGRIIWQRKLPASARSTPVIDDWGQILIPTVNRRLYSYSIDGEYLWEFLFPGIPGTPAPGPEGGSYVTTNAGTLVSISPEGRFRWDYRCEGVLFPPVYDESGIFIASGEGTVWMFSSAGDLLWRQRIARKFFAPPLLGEGALYLLSDTGRVYQIEKKTGRVVDSSEPGSPGGGFLLGSENIYLGGNDWVLYGYGKEGKPHLFPGFYQKADWSAGDECYPSWRQPGYDGNHRGWRRDLADRRTEGSEEFAIILEIFSRIGRAGRIMILEEIESCFTKESQEARFYFYLGVLEYMASEGIMIPSMEYRRVLNDFPDIRARVYRLLGANGDLQSQRTLIELAAREWDYHALAACLTAIGSLGSDPQGFGIQTMKRIFRKTRGDRNETLINAMLTALKGIKEYHGIFQDEGGYELIVEILMGNYSREIRAIALNVMRL